MGTGAPLQAFAACEAVAVPREELHHLLLPGIDDRQPVEHRQAAGQRAVEQPAPHVRQRVVVRLSKMEDRHAGNLPKVKPDLHAFDRGFAERLQRIKFCGKAVRTACRIRGAFENFPQSLNTVVFFQVQDCK